MTVMQLLSISSKAAAHHGAQQELHRRRHPGPRPPLPSAEGRCHLCESLTWACLTAITWPALRAPLTPLASPCRGVPGQCSISRLSRLPSPAKTLPSPAVKQGSVTWFWTQARGREEPQEAGSYFGWAVGELNSHFVLASS